MGKKDAIKIRSSLQNEISSEIVAGGKKYLILTENIDTLKPLITTKVYLGGKIISTRNMDCKNVLNGPISREKITELVRGQHELIADVLRKENVKKPKSSSYYLEEVKELLQKKNNRGAIEVLIRALKEYPNDPFFLSYYGCLEAVINKNYADGIGTCARAIELLDEKMPFGQEIFYPTFYLNLGRSYVAAKNKGDAIKAFQKGLSFNKENKDLLWEIKRLGVRRRPAVPYLKRSNPINRCIGMILHKLSPGS